MSSSSSSSSSSSCEYLPVFFFQVVKNYQYQNERSFACSNFRVVYGPCDRDQVISKFVSFFFFLCLFISLFLSFFFFLSLFIDCFSSFFSHLFSLFLYLCLYSFFVTFFAFFLSFCIYSFIFLSFFLPFQYFLY